MDGGAALRPRCTGDTAHEPGICRALRGLSPNTGGGDLTKLHVDGEAAASLRSDLRLRLFEL